MKDGFDGKEAIPDQYNEQMLKEIQYYMVEQLYPKGVDIAVRGQPCQSIIFIINGLVELRVDDMFGNIYSFLELRQGDIVGQYSTIFKEELMFTVKAKTNVRILTLDYNFFIEKIKKKFSETNFCAIEGLEQAVFRAEELVNRADGYSCVPLCDYKIMFRDN